jgi:hypothetical protein
MANDKTRFYKALYGTDGPFFYPPINPDLKLPSKFLNKS